MKKAAKAGNPLHAYCDGPVAITAHGNFSEIKLYMNYVEKSCLENRKNA